MARILIIEDEEAIRNVLANIISEEKEKHEVDTAENGMAGVAKFKDQEYDLILCDIKMPKMDGMEVLDRLMALKPDTPMIMISGHGDIETAVNALKKGAYDFIAKPPDLNRLLLSIRNALDRKDLVQENEKLNRQNKLLKKKVSDRYQMIGQSKALQEIKEMIEKVAPTDARVLITGPNGSGKELVANAIYEQSERSDKAMVEVNCAAIPSELIESELFGHMKGSFTGAVKDKSGKFEQAHQGTLFLDEVGDMSLSAQAKVLRALQEGRVTRVGGDKEINVNVRVIAATNKNLVEEIEKGNFREDLYHRLSVIEIRVPALNDRKEDIPELVDFFAERIANEYGNQAKSFNAEAIKALQKYNWSGNIRELRNIIERLIILCGNPITQKDVAQYINS